MKKRTHQLRQILFLSFCFVLFVPSSYGLSATELARDGSIRIQGPIVEEKDIGIMKQDVRKQRQTPQDRYQIQRENISEEDRLPRFIIDQKTHSRPSPPPPMPSAPQPSKKQLPTVWPKEQDIIRQTQEQAEPKSPVSTVADIQAIRVLSHQPYSAPEAQLPLPASLSFPVPPQTNKEVFVSDAPPSQKEKLLPLPSLPDRQNLTNQPQQQSHEQQQKQRHERQEDQLVQRRRRCDHRKEKSEFIKKYIQSRIDDKQSVQEKILKGQGGHILSLQKNGATTHHPLSMAVSKILLISLCGCAASVLVLSS